MATHPKGNGPFAVVGKPRQDNVEYSAARAYGKKRGLPVPSTAAERLSHSLALALGWTERQWAAAMKGSRAKSPHAVTLFDQVRNTSGRRAGNDNQNEGDQHRRSASARRAEFKFNRYVFLPLLKEVL